MAGARPRASVFMFVRNGAGSVRRAIDSVLAQTCTDIEFIVQDAASTDGTLDILASYGDRLNVVSAPDSGPSEGLLRALNRCTGDVVGSCLADEELLPDAVARAVAAFEEAPDTGAITGDAIITDLAGVQTGFWKSGPFNLIDYLACDYTPYFCSSFFRRQALLDAGLKSRAWSTDCVEFDLWCSLAAITRIAYLPETFAKYAAHAGQSSNNQRHVAVHFAGRLKRIVAMCSAEGFFGESPLLRALFIRGHARAFINHALLNNLPDIAADLHRIEMEALAPFPPALLDGRPLEDGKGDAPLQENWLIGWWRRLAATKPAGASPTPVPPPIDDRVKARMYAELARRYEADGRLREALDLWRAAGTIGGLNGLDRELPPLDRPHYTAVQRG